MDSLFFLNLYLGVLVVIYALLVYNYINATQLPQQPSNQLRCVPV
jgi:hypothetical protein